MDLLRDFETLELSHALDLVVKLKLLVLGPVGLREIMDFYLVLDNCDWVIHGVALIAHVKQLEALTNRRLVCRRLR